MNNVIVTPEQDAFLVKDNIYEFSYGFIEFLTNPIVLYDDIEEDETRTKRFLQDVRHDTGKGDKRSSRYRTIKRILGLKDDVFGKGLNSIDLNPNN